MRESCRLSVISSQLSVISFGFRLPVETPHRGVSEIDYWTFIGWVLDIPFSWKEYPIINIWKLPKNESFKIAKIVKRLQDRITVGKIRTNKVNNINRRFTFLMKF